MKATFAIMFLATAVAGSLNAQVELLPPDFTLFGKNSGDYAAEYLQYTLPLSTNGDYLLPNAVPSPTEPVYFLQRPLFGTPPPVGIQTYFIPDDVYVYFPIDFFWADNIDSCPPCFTVEDLRNGLRKFIDQIASVHAAVNGVVLTNLLAYRTESPVFSVFLPSANNAYSVLLPHPIEGLDDPVIDSGYFLMFKPFPAGLYDFRTGASNGPPNSFSFERHFQVYSLSSREMAERQIEELIRAVVNSSLEPRQQRPLLASLNAANASLALEQFQPCVNQLHGFQNKVRAQVARSDPALADDLANAAQGIVDRAQTQLR